MLSKNLDWTPESGSKKQDLLSGLTGRLLHEIGHVVAAAAQGYPTDLLILDEKPGSQLDCAYMDDSIRSKLASDTNSEGKILAAGLMAEYTIFSQAAVLRACSDIEALSRIYRIPLNLNDNNSILFAANKIRDIYKSLFESKNKSKIKSVYRNIAALIANNNMKIDDAFVIPIDIWFSDLHEKNDPLANSALVRSRQHNYASGVLADLRRHTGKSGV